MNIRSNNQEVFNSMKILRAALYSFLASTIALVLSDQVFYKYWYIPRYASLQNVPFFYEYMALIPIVLSVLVLALTVSSWRQVLTCSIVFALNHQCYDFFTGKSHHSGELVRYIMENPADFWLVRSLIMLSIYFTAFGLVWYARITFKKPIMRAVTRFYPGRTEPARSAATAARRAARMRRKINGEENMPKRIAYHVLPDTDGWQVKKGKAKKASSIHKTKREALRVASDLAKNHPRSQVIIHRASGLIESDRTFEHIHYTKKRKKRAVVRKIRIGIKRSRRKQYEDRLRRKKAARLGISRTRRKQYLRSLAAKKAARTRKKRGR
jgi:hypothetical protein